MISQSRYVNIVSGVGAGAGAAQRQLIMRIVTQNAALPPGVVMEFKNASDVSTYFGSNSEESKRATAYFGFVSKSIYSPSAISFSRWVNTAIAPMIVGDTTTKSLAGLVTFTAGTLTLQVDATQVNIAGIDLSTATSLTQVAALLQAEIRASLNPQLTTCTVAYDTNTNQFNLTGAVTGSGSIIVLPDTLPADCSAELGWGTSGTVYVNGQAAETATAAISNSAAISNNFGSFVYTKPAVPMTNADIAEVAAWNSAQNNAYMYSVATPSSNLAALYGLTKGSSGCALNILSSTLANDYIEQSPCEILAATNYNSAGATQNYMYYQFPNRNITVSTDAGADAADLSRGNYIGVTQSAGQQVAFYQRGVLCGSSTAAVDMNTYANEIWLKSDIAATILALQLSSGRIPANQDGSASILGVLQQSINKAKTNGTISAGKTLSPSQQQFVTQLSGDPTAWRQVSTLGYWVNVFFSSYTTPDSRVEFKANYTLIYSKDDAIRVVNGTDALV